MAYKNSGAGNFRQSLKTGAAGALPATTTGRARMADQFVNSAKISQDVIQIATGSLTNAEMLALRAAPKTLVAAPGAGFVLEFMSLSLFFDYTGAYTETADNMAVRYTDGSGTIVSQAIEATGFVDATADTMQNALPKIDAISAKTACDNKALVLHNTGDGEYGGGNAANVMRYSIAYRVRTAGW